MARRSIALGLVCFCLAALSAPAPAQSVAEFYKSNPLVIVCGYTTGSIYDMYARIIAKYVPKYLPGRPTVIVQNMPGAGSLKSANYLANIAPKDGSQIATFSRSIVMQPIVDSRGVYFDATRMNWLGTPASEVSVVFSWHTTSFKTVHDILTREMTVAATGPGADSAVFPYVMNSVIGTKFKVVLGYPGAAETMLAIERGEADGSAGTSWGGLVSSKSTWLEQKKINVILQLSTKKLPALGDVPLVVDLAKSEAERQALELVFAREELAYPFTAPPDIPADRLQALSQAFAATMRDAEFLAEVRGHNIDVDPLTAEQVSALVRKVYSSSPQAIARVKTAIEEGTKTSGNR